MGRHLHDDDDRGTPLEFALLVLVGAAIWLGAIAVGVGLIR